jgi:TolB-like protein
MSRFARLAPTLLAAAILSLPVGRVDAQGDNRPVVAVLDFANNAFGKLAAEYEGIGKGIGEMLLTDLTATGRFRMVERTRLQAVLEEHKLAREGAIDARTAARIGRILGAQYIIAGQFVMDLKGTMLLNARAIDVETSLVSNPQKVQSKTDDVLPQIEELSRRLQKDLKLPERVADAGTQQSGGERDQKVTPPVERSSQKQPKMDVRTTLLYAKALDEQDRGNAQRATELYRAVLVRVPDYQPAKAKLAKLEKAKS